jgi:branched-chain amino acid transport system permease protein
MGLNDGALPGAIDNAAARARSRLAVTWLVAGVTLAFLLAVVPIVFADRLYVLRVLSTASVLSLISLGVWITFSIGRINLGQGGFALIGGYVTAILMTRWGISYWLALPASGILAAAFGIVLGLGILRLRGVYFAMITLSLTEAVRLAFLSGGSFTGGAPGIPVIPLPGALSVFGMTVIPDFARVDSHLAFYYLAAALLIVGFAVTWRIAGSRVGWVFRSLQQNEDLATSIGINVTKYRVMAFGICCFLGGLGGSYFAVAQQSIYPAVFGVTDSVFFTLYCFLGGLAYVIGPVIGAFLLFICFEVLSANLPQEFQQLAYALIMIAIMLWLPNGILSLRPPAWLRILGGAPAAARQPKRAT